MHTSETEITPKSDISANPPFPRPRYIPFFEISYHFCFCRAALILVTFVAYQDFAIPKNVRNFTFVTLSNQQYYLLRCTSPLLLLAYLLY